MLNVINSKTNKNLQIYLHFIKENATIGIEQL